MKKKRKENDTSMKSSCGSEREKLIEIRMRRRWCI